VRNERYDVHSVSLAYDGNVTSSPRLAATIASNASLAVARVLIQTISVFAASVLLTRVLGPSDFGTYRLALSIVWVLEFATVLAFPSATTKFVAELADREPGTTFHVLRFFLVRATVCYVVVAVPFVLLSPVIARFYHDETLVPLLILGGVSVLPGLWSGIFQAALRGRQRFGALSLMAVTHAVVNFTLIGVLLWQGGRVFALFALFIVLNALNLVMALAWTWPDVRRPATGAAVPAEARRRMLRYAVLFGATNAANLLLSERVEVFFLGRLWNSAEVGFYSLAVSLALYTRRLAPTALDEVLFPVIARLEGAGERWSVANAWVHSSRYLAMLGFPMLFGGALVAEPAVVLLFGATYRPAASALALLISAAGFVAVAHPAGSVILSQERHRFLLTGTVLAGVASVLLDLALIPPYGAVGAAAANSVILAGWSSVQIGYVASRLRARLPLGNLARLGAAAAIAILPGLAIRMWAPAPPAVELALILVTFVLIYPFALVAMRSLLPDDVERLLAAADALPRLMRVPLRRALGHLRPAATA